MTLSKIKKKKDQYLPSLYGELVHKKYNLLTKTLHTIQTWWLYPPRIKECWDNGILACVQLFLPP